ncbi:alpha/beta fold hydrolase [Solwaraspora sp. WMMD406]|uniref:alpha/beta fold hydrolase n=1 Tax=Solwaraspora sp. WMMD406 TaxID=3016095 RepID=UPI002415B29A|nr:alpha/beta fold hydrolase [Solwaraspora sp. WMMD406]MDG4762589.1 alpha/beta fold hydrolase [Solwaraspora sp. WMMD406]
MRPTLRTDDTTAERRPDTGHPEPIPLVVPGDWTSIDQRLRHIADTTPNALAVAAPDGQYSYAELWRVAHDRARAVRAHTADLAPHIPLALTIESTARCTSALLAVVLAGRAVIPLDPTLPSQRAEQILDIAGARRIDTDTIAGLPDGPGHLPDSAGDDAAVIFFTSGSTGRPKGVVHSHATWLNQAYVARRALDLIPADRNALVMPLSYGGGLDVLFMSLLTGSSVHVYDPRLLGLNGMLSWLRDQQVSTVHLTPALLRSILDAPGAQATFTTVRMVTSLGEAIHSTMVRRLRARLTSTSAFVSWSGASEIGIMAHYRLPASEPVPPGIVPVGTPAANKTIEVIGEDGQPLPPGVTGEVVITSRYLSSGYLNDPDQTAARFRRNADGTTTYRGGDLGQWDSDGVLHLKGRLDSAVKIGGYLVEPADVEAALLDSPDIAEAVVTVVPTLDDTGATRAALIAHVVPVAADHSTTPASVRRTLRERLPSWMVPAQIVLLSRLPRNERSKIDRSALPAIPEQRPVRPQTPTERLLADIWCAVLGLPEVAANADFWQLGADSLAVQEMIVAVRRATGTALRSRDLAATPTIAELATLIDRREARRDTLPATAVTLRTAADVTTTGRTRTTLGRRPTLFGFAGGGAPALSLLPLAMALRTDLPMIGFQASGYETRGRSDWRLSSVVRRHLKVIRSTAPHGPYILIGHSYGGLLALETAARLAATGAQVPLVVLLDTVLPDRISAAARAAAGVDGDAPSAPPLWDRLRMHTRLAGAGLVRYSPQVREEVFWEQSLRLVNRHRLTSWPGRTLLFTTPSNPDRPQWWTTVLTGPHTVVPVDGGHSSILRPPFCQPIVDRLDAELSRYLDGGTA